MGAVRRRRRRRRPSHPADSFAPLLRPAPCHRFLNSCETRRRLPPDCWHAPPAGRPPSGKTHGPLLSCLSHPHDPLSPRAHSHTSFRRQAGHAPLRLEELRDSGPLGSVPHPNPAGGYCFCRYVFKLNHPHHDCYTKKGIPGTHCALFRRPYFFNEVTKTKDQSVNRKSVNYFPRGC